LLVADFCAVALATAVSSYLTWVVWPSAAGGGLLLAAALTLSVVAVNHYMGLYPGAGLSPLAELRATISSTLCAVGLFLLVALPITNIEPPVRFFLVVATVLIWVGMGVARWLARSMCSRFSWWGQTAMIVGSEASVEAAYSYFHCNPRLGLRPLAADRNGFGNRLGTIGPEEFHAWLPTPASSEGADPACVIVATPRCNVDDAQTVLRCYWQQSRPMLLAHLGATAVVGSQAAGFLDRLRAPSPGGAQAAQRLAKRTVDVVAVVVGGLLVLPLILLIAALIKLQSPGPVFYQQERIGRHGRRFKVWKFRTMVRDADKILEDSLAASPERRREWQLNHKLQNDPRVTSLGRWLRKTSLDELPQLWNVLRGEMSLVGPRPIVTKEIEKYGDRFARYCAVTPGMTGLWQVSGRNDTTYAERVDLDSYYAGNWSLWLDLYILLLTVKVVLFRQGAY
jgi:Undecaprenyl-phosphate galactose phosphotransferase WbaP